MNIFAKVKRRIRVWKELSVNHSNIVEKYKDKKSPHAIFKESQILVLTSAFEGLPLVLIEGLFFSLPEVSFDCPCGPADIIDDGQNGFLIPCFDEDLFAEKLLQLMEDDSLRERFSLRAKEKSSSFLPENIMPLWDHLLKSLE